MKKLLIYLLVACFVLLGGIVWHQYWVIEELQYRLDLYEQQPQKIWA